MGVPMSLPVVGVPMSLPVAGVQMSLPVVGVSGTRIRREDITFQSVGFG